MSQFPSAPQPGAYTPPNQNTPVPQPQYGYQQPQASAPYGSSASVHGSSQQHGTNKPTNAFGQAFNQAVTQGKPMLNKLGKSISSKLGNKPTSPTTPQHLQNYQTYQQSQQHNQQSNQQQYPPQPYQAQGQYSNPQPEQQNPYFSSQQAPYQQPHHAGTVYNPQQSSTPSNHPTNPPPPAHVGYKPAGYGQGEYVAGQHQDQPPQGHYNPGQAQHQTYFHQNQALPESGQESGVIGNSQPPVQFASSVPPPPPSNPQQPWGSHPGQHPSIGQATTTPTQHQQLYNQAPPPPQAPQAAEQQQAWSQPPPQTPQTANEQQQWPPHSAQQTTGITQHQSFNPSPPPLQYHAAPPVPPHPNQQQPQWNPASPASSQAPMHSPIPPSVSPALSQPPTPAPLPAAPQAVPPPTDFVAELPADMANLSMAEGSQGMPPSNNPAHPSYQPYRPAGSQSTSPQQRRFSIARRAVSTSSLPVADPWRFADPATELPTREFYMIADLIYDAIDGKFEPKNTGLLEANKVLESWKVLGLAEDAAQVFAYDSYKGFAKLWSLEGIPHVMVPCQALLTPLWNFQPQTHSEAMKVPMGMVLGDVVETTYVAAINRAGFYKYFFLEMMHEPESLEAMLSKLCAETYNPSMLNQPDVQKRDRSNTLPGVAAQAATIRSACVSVVTKETSALMQQSARSANQSSVASTAGQTSAVPGDSNQQQGQPGQTGSGGTMTADEQMLVQMHSLKMQQQFNHMMAATMVGGLGAPNYGGLI
ncbi:unnamed protein product [Periconia digitata]|uniref:Uncharacterized protein n=1 Tax=Periconia digitata TaxID=1303443 RepID=A0A9W4UV19_9PLEO|nr:unnamed protein product [Periconia digitata]